MVIKPDFEENRANLEKGRVKIDLVINLTIPSYERGVARLLRYDRHP